MNSIHIIISEIHLSQMRENPKPNQNFQKHFQFFKNKPNQEYSKALVLQENLKGTNWKYKLNISKRIRTQYSSQFLFRRKPSADSRPYFLLLLSLSPLKFLFLFLILSAFSPIFLICCLVKTCPNLPKLAQTCAKLSKFPFSPLFPLFL